VRAETNTVLLGLALGWGPWLLVAGLALAEGVADRMFSISLVAGHARLLLVVPLIFISESWVAPRMAAFVGTIARSGVVARAIVLSWMRKSRALVDGRTGRGPKPSACWPHTPGDHRAPLQTYGESGAFDPARHSLAFFVYFHVACWCSASWYSELPGNWRFGVCSSGECPGSTFISSPFILIASGGLGSLAGVHERFAPLAAALSILESAALAESISTGALAVTAVYPTLALLLLLDGALFLGPLLVFTDKLWAGRTKGVSLCNELAARYVREFEAKWLEGPSATEPLLGTPDVQSLADLANVVSVAKSMRWITIGARLLTIMTIAIVGPLMPLLLFRYPVAELSQKFFSRLVGF
jgi:uncharacterized membrane protein YfbV (UPF0208 family)